MNENKKGDAPKLEAQIPGLPGARRGVGFAEIQKAENIGKTVKRLLVYFAKEKILVIGMLAVVIIGTFCGIIAPGLQSDAIDTIVGTKDSALSSILFLMLIAYLIYGAAQLVQTIFGSYLSQRIVRKMREDLFDKIIDLPVKYLDTHSHGDVISRMTNDIENISTTISQSIVSLCSGALTIVGTICMMLWYCWQLALLSGATVILTLLATKFLSKKIRKYSRKRQALLGEINGITEEMISNYQTVVAYNHQERTVSDFCEIADNMTKAGIKTDVFSGVMMPVMNCISNIGFVIIAAVGGIFSTHSLITVGVISAFIVYAKQFSKPINEIANIYGQLQTAIAGAERVFWVLDEPSECKNGDCLKEHQNADVSFENVSFSYDGSHKVLNDFSLTVPSGKKVALVGATGSGKTTAVNLLMKFYNPDEGVIRIGNRNIADIKPEFLRKSIAIVLQDTLLFSDTVRSNLLYGNENADTEQLERALKMSCCDTLLEAFPNGIDTLLTNSGANISQGQKQLLAIARAFIADPQILILDEATSNVDTRTEKLIQNAMQQIMKNRTGIVIAHRLSTIQDSDVIIVMDRGRIAESGNHTELLAKKGKYYDLYMTQFAGYET